MASPQRVLSHTEMVYAPGERALARDFFRAIGCRVLDPQTDECPEGLGPAAEPYLVIFVDPEDRDLFDNVLYASEVPAEQWAFEQALRGAMQAGELSRTFGAFAESFRRFPQGITHLGLGVTEPQLERAVRTIAETPELAKRVEVAGPYRPGGPGAVDPRVIQAFLRTDIVSGSLLCAGQQIELQVRIDRPRGS
jgi:hypothetical protein